jgi:hypothetical protein
MSTIFTTIIKYRWFYEEFNEANGLQWLLCIALNNAFNRGVITHLLVDQAIFSTARKDISTILLTSYQYLQTVGTAPGPKITTLRESDEIHLLRDAFIWLLANSLNICNIKSDEAEQTDRKAITKVPNFATIGRRKVGWYGWSSAGEIRSMRFITGMSFIEQEEWMTMIKLLAMGTTLGGLRPGPWYRKDRFVRDPDSICAKIAY